MTRYVPRGVQIIEHSMNTATMHHISRPPKITHAGGSGADHQHNMHMVHHLAGDSSPVGMGNFRWS
jgi:hypothetical protein